MDSSFERAKRFFLAGLQCLERKDLTGAENAFASSVELLPDRTSTLNNLAAVKLQLDKLDEAEVLTRRVLSLEDDSVEAWTNLGIILVRTDRSAEALLAYEKALERNFMFARAWHGKAEALLALGRNAEALDVCEQAARMEPTNDGVLYTQSRILKALDRAEDARKVYLKALAARVIKAPVFSPVRRSSQQADILVITPDLALGDELRSFEQLHWQCPNYAGQLIRSIPDEFHFSMVFIGDALNPAGRAQIPRPDLVINNCANVELINAKGLLPGVTELLDGLGVPVINHPAKVVPSSRDIGARLIAGIPGVKVPRTVRFSAEGKSMDELIREIEEQFAYPIITRTLVMQKGVGMTKCESRDELLVQLLGGLPKQFFVTEFVETRRGSELYRKIRASVVLDEIVISRVDFLESWNVHSARYGARAEYYRQRPHLLQMERHICADPDRELGRSAMESLRAIRERMPLDVFGVDFEVDAEGRLVFFEANATMNLLASGEADVATSKEANDRLLDAFRRYFISLAGRR